jgi:hypothetical protein
MFTRRARPQVQSHQNRFRSELELKIILDKNSSSRSFLPQSSRFVFVRAEEKCRSEKISSSVFARAIQSFLSRMQLKIISDEKAFR